MTWFTALLALLCLTGCGTNRIYQNFQSEPPTFEFAVIETPYQTIKAQTAEVLAPFYTITTRAEAHAAGNEDRTLVVEVDGSRGLLGCSSRIMLRRFNSRDRDDGRLVFINETAGLFWAGEERAMVKGMRTLEEEAAQLSAKHRAKK